VDPHLERLFEHMAWADRQLLDALAALDAPSAPMLRLLNHLLGAEQLWLRRVRGEDCAQVPVWPTLSLEACRALAEATGAGFQAFVAAADADQLAARVDYRTSRGQAVTSTLRDMLNQVVLHGCHHRGQIACLMRQEGFEPVGVDYILFTRAQG
jgi:uncharacterized damage-inducible protein DinB